MLITLSSDAIDERIFAVNTILKLQARNNCSSTATKPFKLPETVNLNACELTTLINWNKETITEPIFTAKISIAELDSIKLNPLVLPAYSLPT